MKLQYAMRPAKSPFITWIVLAQTFCFAALVLAAQAKDIKVPEQQKTIGAALEAAASGDRIQVTDKGVYREALCTSKSITLVSVPAGARIEPPEGNGLTLGKGAEVVAVTGFVIANAPGHGILVDPGVTASVDLQLSDVKIEKSGKCGVAVASGKHNVLTGGTGTSFTQNKEDGVWIQSMTDVKLTKCALDENGACGIRAMVKDNVGDPKEAAKVMLADCTLSGNGAEGMHYWGKIQAAFQNCHVLTNKGSGASVGGAMELAFDNCEIAGAGRSGFELSFDPKSTSRSDRLLMLSLKHSQIHDNGVKGLNLGGVCDVQLQMEGVTVTNNKDTGLYAQNDPPLKVKAAVTSSTFSSNGNGIGINCASSELQLLGCAVDENKGTGLSVTASSVVKLDNCTFQKNGGDGVYLPSRAKEAPKVELAMERCKVIGNKRYGLACLGAYDLNATLAASTFEANSSGVQLALDRGYKGVVRMSGVTSSGNAFSGVAHSGGDFEISMANQCVFERNGDRGNAISVVSPCRLDVKGARFETAKGAALQVASKTNELDTSVLAQFADCRMAGEGSAAIMLTDAAGATVLVSKSELSGYRDAVQVATGVVAFSRITMSDCTLRLAGGKPVAVANAPVLVFGPMGLDSLTNVPTLECFSDKASVLLTNCGLEGSGAASRSEMLKGLRPFELPGSLPGYLRSDGLPLTPALADSSVSTQTVEQYAQLKKLSFSDWEKDTQQQCTPAVLWSVAAAFAAQTGAKSHTDLLAETLKYLRAHPDEVVSSRLYQSVIGPSIAFLDDEDLTVLAAIVKDGPNTLLADTVCSELAAQSAYWPLADKARQTFVRLCKVAPDTLAGTFVGVLTGNETAPAAQLKKAWDAYNLVETKYPQVRQRLRMTGLEGDGGKRNIEKWDTFLRSCAVMDNCIVQSKLWHSLGADDVAEEYLSLARGAGLNVYPMLPANLYLPESLSGAFKIGKEAFPDSPRMDLPAILALEAKSSGGDAENAMKGRVADYKAAIGLSAYFYPSFGAFAGQPNTKASKNEALHRFLNELTQVLKVGITPTVGLDESRADANSGSGATRSLKIYMDGFEKDVVPLLTPKEKNEALAWLETAVPSNSLKDAGIQQAYAEGMARCYKAAENFAKEAEEQEKIAEVADKPAAKVAALERLAVLYEDKWGLPDRAIIALRKIIEVADNMDEKVQTRLKIAKILYKEKNYQQVVFELSTLLSQMPKKYDSAAPGKKYDIVPVRMMLAMAYLGIGSYDECRAELKLVTEGEESKSRAQGLYLTGYSYICEQKYADAVQPFKALVSQYPESEFAKKAQDFLGKLEKVSVGGAQTSPVAAAGV